MAANQLVFYFIESTRISNFLSKNDEQLDWDILENNDLLAIECIDVNCIHYYFSEFLDQNDHWQSGSNLYGSLDSNCIVYSLNDNYKISEISVRFDLLSTGLDNFIQEVVDFSQKHGLILLQIIPNFKLQNANFKGIYNLLENVKFKALK